MKKIISSALAIFFAFSTALGRIGVFFGGNDLLDGVDRLLVKASSVKGADFGVVSADEVNISEQEKTRCRHWFDENVLHAVENGHAPAFDFRMGNKTLRGTLSQWSSSVGEESAEGEYEDGGKTTFVTLTNAALSLCATIKATIYEGQAVCEWTVCLKNTASGNSPRISDFYALDNSFEISGAKVCYTAGSSNSADDYTLKTLDPSAFGNIEKRFTNTDGRSSDGYMPYFNVCGSGDGFVLGVGWTGQWETRFKQESGALRVFVKQEFLNAYLLPGEEIRSPLVAVGFYDGDSPLKGFNQLRSWLGIISPDVTDETAFFCYANEQKYTSNMPLTQSLIDGGADFNALWVDAAWYPLVNGDWHNSVGSWSASASDPEKYPNGISELGDFANRNNLKLLLWYEPERVCVNSELFTVGKQNGWLIGRDKWLRDDDADIGSWLWNLGDKHALAYLCSYIDASVKGIGVDIYRQDFNIDPLEFWRCTDKKLYDNRTGITENHHITNLYDYWDYLLTHNEGLMIDNCSSGGRRLDPETARRSVALHRSDYGGTSEEMQNQSYGISLWYPDNGLYLRWSSEYEMRSWLTPLNDVAVFSVSGIGAFNAFRSLHSALYPYWFENYYPLTQQNYDTDKWLAMQFGGEIGGAVYVYKRAEVSGNVFTLKMQGLSPNVEYTLTDYDNQSAPVIYTGAELMNGIDLTVQTAPKACIYFYAAQ